MENVTEEYRSYKSLQYSMYVNSIVCSLGAICFFATAHFISRDRKRVNDIVHRGRLEIKFDNLFS